MEKNKIIVVFGQTSTGKSDFAVKIAKKIEGEIISADSRQVYKGMDLGTGKITKKEMRNVPHYLLDVVSPKRVFSVDDFQKLANKKIEEIFERGKIPIICGGTGFYIDSIINENIFPEVPPNKELRKELANKKAPELFQILKKLDKDRAENIDRNNPVRLIRAIEIARTLGKVPILHRSDLCKYEVLKIGLVVPDETLKERILIRIKKRIKKGMIKEVENLHNQGISWKRLESFGLEYRYISEYLKSISTQPSPRLRRAKKEEMIDKLNTETWHYAKRQKTWFKRDKSIIWIDPTKNKDKNLALREIKKFL